MPSTTVAGSGQSSRRTWILTAFIWCSSSDSTSLTTTLRSTGPRSCEACPPRASVSSPFTIFAARKVWRSIFSSSFVSGDSGSAFSSSIWV